MEDRGIADWSSYLWFHEVLKLANTCNSESQRIGAIRKIHVHYQRLEERSGIMDVNVDRLMALREIQIWQLPACEREEWETVLYPALAHLPPRISHCTLEVEAVVMPNGLTAMANAIVTYCTDLKSVEIIIKRGVIRRRRALHYYFTRWRKERPGASLAICLLEINNHMNDSEAVVTIRIDGQSYDIIWACEVLGIPEPGQEDVS